MARKKSKKKVSYLPVQVVQKDGKQTIANEIKTDQLNRNARLLTNVQKREKTIGGKVVNRSLKAMRAIEKGIAFTSGTSKKSGRNYNMNKIINLGILLKGKSLFRSK